MPHNRRHFITQSLTLLSGALVFASGLFTPLLVKAAWKSGDFSAGNLQHAMQQVFGEQTFNPSDKIKLKLPRIAENGKVVPITITSSLENIDTVAIFVEKNPVPHIASFKLSDISTNDISARMKMAETSDVIVIVKTTDNHYYSTRQMVKVTIGGCGG